MIVHLRGPLLLGPMACHLRRVICQRPFLANDTPGANESSRLRLEVLLFPQTAQASTCAAPNEPKTLPSPNQLSQISLHFRQHAHGAGNFHVLIDRLFITLNIASTNLTRYLDHSIVILGVTQQLLHSFLTKFDWATAALCFLLQITNSFAAAGFICIPIALAATSTMQ